MSSPRTQQSVERLAQLTPRQIVEELDRYIVGQADAKKAGTAPLTIGVSIEKGGSADERVQMNSSRMVVVSNATFVQNNALTQDQQGLDFISASANWLLSREQLIGIAPKIPKTLTFSLNEDALRDLRWMILVLIPLVFVALGTAVWWKRRA